MSDKTYKKWDSDDNYIQHNARLAFDPEVKEFSGKKFVRIKFTSETRGEDAQGKDRYSTMWVEALVSDFESDKAAMLKKGDVLTVEGKPAIRIWGDDDKASFELVRARLHLPVSLFMELQERGFSPGGKPGKSKPAPKAGKRSKKVVEIPEDDDGE